MKKITLIMVIIMMMTNTTACAQTMDSQQLSVQNIKSGEFLAIDSGFIDVPTSEWYVDSVTYCKDNDVMSGISQTEFAPGNAISRSMLTTILWRLDGSKIVPNEISFDDVSENTWYAEAVQWAVHADVVNGLGNNIFGINSFLTKEQAISILFKYEEYKNGETLVTGSLIYDDRDSISDWAINPVLWATKNNITIEKPNNIFDPKADASRAEIAVMIHRYLTSNNNENQTINELDNTIDVNVIVGNYTFDAKFYDNEVTQSLIEMMPFTIEMSDLNNNEKYYRFFNSFNASTEQPAEIKAGEIMLWSGNTLVLFYETFSNSYGGYVPIGYIQDVDGLSEALGFSNVSITFNNK